MVRLLATFLEQRHPPDDQAVSAPTLGAHVALTHLDPDTYLEIYQQVGSRVQWDDRLRMSRADLEAHLSDNRTQLFLMTMEDRAGGLLEAVRDNKEGIEITNFGIVSELEGKGLGWFLLVSALRQLWQNAPVRIWLHTDTNDHPAAIPTYLKAGFVIYKNQWLEFPD